MCKITINFKSYYLSDYQRCLGDMAKIKMLKCKIDRAKNRFSDIIYRRASKIILNKCSGILSFR